jgi:hypothetical protein
LATVFVTLFAITASVMAVSIALNIIIILTLCLKKKIKIQPTAVPPPNPTHNKKLSTIDSGTKTDNSES